MQDLSSHDGFVDQTEVIHICSGYMVGMCRDLVTGLDRIVKRRVEGAFASRLPSRRQE